MDKLTRRVFKLSQHVEHPGVQLRKKFLPLLGVEHQQATVLAHIMQLPRKRVADLLRGKEDVDQTIAVALGRIFNVHPMFWTSLQNVYNHSEKPFGTPYGKEIT